MDMAACAKFVPVMEQLKFKHVPKAFGGEKEVPPIQNLERALRDAGCSRKAAKSILAKGVSEDLRDAGAADDPQPVSEPLRDAEGGEPVKMEITDKGKRIADRHLYLTH
jgi:hypothetical protein